MWYVMENLTINSLYEVYVYVSDGKLQSRSSSVITMLAALGIFISHVLVNRFCNFTFLCYYRRMILVSKLRRYHGQRYLNTRSL